MMTHNTAVEYLALRAEAEQAIREAGAKVMAALDVARKVILAEVMAYPALYRESGYGDPATDRLRVLLGVGTGSFVLPGKARFAVAREETEELVWAGGELYSMNPLRKPDADTLAEHLPPIYFSGDEDAIRDRVREILDKTGPRED